MKIETVSILISLISAFASTSFAIIALSQSHIINILIDNYLHNNIIISIVVIAALSVAAIISFIVVKILNN